MVERPKAKRLRPGKSHRNALLESLPEEQRPVAEQVVLGGLPAVRQAIEKQNAERAAAGDATIPAGPLLELAEKLVPKVRNAEWRDRAEAAQRDLEVVDLRDLRSVVSTADASAKDDESRALAQTLREGLAARADAEHQAWLAELTATVEVGRIVRALRLSSRPPKAGSPLPAELATKLAEGAGAALTDDAPAERWVAVLDALAFAPVRDKVIPTSLPKDLHDDVKATIARLATRIPKIAHIFEIEPDRNAPRPKFERRRPKKAGPKPKPEKAKKPKDEAKTEAPKDEPKVDEPTTQATVTEEPATPRPSSTPAEDTPQGRVDARGRPRADRRSRTPQPPQRAKRAPGPADERTSGWSKGCRPWRTCRPRSRSRQRTKRPAKPLGVRGSPPQVRRRAAPPPRRSLSASRRRARRERAEGERLARGRRPQAAELEDRPRYSPVVGSSSQRAPHELQAHESSRSEAR